MSNERLLRETEAFLHEQIPMTRAMGVRFAAYEGDQLVLEAPLAQNHNHLGTAFGGSLGAIATLAGYALIWLELRDPACHVVIRDSSLSFRRPVRTNIRAVCRRPEETVLAAFKGELARQGKARLSLSVAIGDEGVVSVAFQGTFVALRH